MYLKSFRVLLGAFVVLVLLPGTRIAHAQTTGVYQEIYLGIAGNNVSDLTSAAKFPNSPDQTAYLTNSFEAGINIADNYGQRCRGLITAPLTGSYIFWISSDDASQLYLSTDSNPANKVPIANVSTWTSSREWTKEANQQSAAKPLVAGQRYYIEALQKEGGGGDNLAVRWQLPNATIEEPIPGTRLSPFTGLATSPPTISGQPTNTTVMEGSSANFYIQTSNLDTLVYQWQRNSNNIPGATSSTLTLAAVALTNSGSFYRCVLSNSLGLTISSNATLTVTPDTVAPLLLSAASAGYSGVRVTFSEPVQPLTATNPANYVITNSAGTLAVIGANFGASNQTIVLTTANQTPGNRYVLTVNNVRDASSNTNLIAANSQAVFTNIAFTVGYIRRELFYGISGNNVSDLTASPIYPNSPSAIDYPPSFAWPGENIADSYGSRVWGYLMPPTNGTYTFAIRSDDASQLSLSTDEQPANKVLLTTEPGCCEAFDAHVSGPVTLVGGQKYYIEALMKEGAGGDYLYVAWKTPLDAAFWNVIPGSALGNYLTDPSATITISQQPSNTTVVSGQSATFSVTATGSSSITTNLTYQWQRNSADIPGANSASYTTPPVVESDSNTTYRVVLSIPGKSLASANAVLSVLPDTFPPTIATAQNIGTTNVLVTYSEAVEAATATNSANYTINSGITVSSAQFGSDTRSILLTVSALSFGTNYTVHISNVRDRAASPNTIAPNSTFTFLATQYSPVDIGNPAQAGSLTVVSNGFNIIAGGTDIGSSSDQFQFSYQQRTGNFDVKVRVASLGVSDIWAKAGLMAREDLSAASRFAAVLSTPSLSGSFFESRDPAGSLSSSSGWFPPNFSETWLRLQRVGNVFTGYASYDGATWTQLGTVTETLPNTVYFGVATASHTTSQTTAAQYRDLTDVINGTTGTLTLPVEPLGPSTRRTGLVISEIMYHPASRTDGRDLEFVEVFNSTPMDEPLTGFRLSSEIDFAFPAGTILKPGAFLVIAKVPADIQAVYGVSNVVGPYAGALNNQAGTIRLRNERDTIILEANYDSKTPWPIAADGAGHSLVLARPSYGEGNAKAWAASAYLGGSPGTGDPVFVQPLQNVVINEFLAHTDLPDVDYIELYNHSTRTNDLSGCFLSDTASTNKFTIPGGTLIPPRGFIAFTENQLGFGLSASGEDIFFRDPAGRVLDTIRFEAQANGVAFGRFPDGADDFHPLVGKTPGTNNAAILVRDLVINEIMYAPISGSDDDQYVEIYNRGTNTADLTSWQFTSGIDYFFPSNVTIAPNGYLVVAKNITNLLSHYPNLNSNNTVGNFSGSLSSKGERLALSMPDDIVSTNSSGNLKTNVIYIVVDEVTYNTGGRWGTWANGGGSSLELIDSRSDHRLAANWADSDESAKAPWTTIEAVGLLDNGSGYNGGPIDNLQIGLTGEGECLLDNVQVIGPAGTNLVANSTLESGLGNWFPTGTHIRSALDTSGGDGSPNCLHIRASARGDTGANRIRTPLSANLSGGQVATIRGRFRWLRGFPEVVMRVHGNWLEAVGRFNLPPNLGTPGAKNSRAVTNAGPAIAAVTHSPILPAANQAVVVSAHVHDYDGISSVQLKYRIDPAASYATVTMLDNGTGGDAIAGDGIFSATIPGQLDATIVAFYIQATDSFAPQATTFFPNNAPTRECLVRWGETQPMSVFGSYRLWLSQNNLNTWVNRLVLSNDPVDGTLVYGNWRAIYNMGAHYAGSPYHQGFDSPVGGGCHYSLDLPDDDQMLGTGNFNKIHAPGNGPFDDDTIQREQTAYWMARQIGLPFNYRRYVNMFVNGQRRGTLMEDTQTPGSDVINAIFPNDANGNLYKLQPWFEMDDATTGQMGFSNNGWCTFNKYTTTNGLHKLARYRWNYLTRNAQTSANEYTNVFNLVDAANTTGPQYPANMEALVDTEEWLRTFAIEHAVGNWDSFGNNNAQNMYGYKPEHGKWNLLIWDYNIVLGNSGSDGPTGDDLFKLNGADAIMPNFVNNPPFRRIYWRAYQDIINGPMRDELVDPILDARYANFLASGINVNSPNAGLKNWISSRRAYIQSQLNTVAANFASTSNGGLDFSTNNNLLTLSGTAPVSIKTITVNGVAFPPTWSTITAFTLSIPLATGNNQLVIQGFDTYGNPVSGASYTINVNYTGPGAQPQDNVVFNEIMYHAAVSDAEYVELFNNSTNVTFDLSNWRIDGIDFNFPPGTIIRPNAFLVVVKDPFVFAGTYGTSIPIAGTYNGSLQNNGETLTLIRPGVTPDLDQIVDIVRYDDKLPWPTIADGFGPSLQLIDPTQDNYRVANWASTTLSNNPPQNLITLTNPWKYNSAGLDLGTAWRAAGFDDSTWSAGQAIFWGTNAVSAPTTGTNTYLPFTNPRQLTFYFRTHFNYSGNPAGVILTTTNMIDDGAVFYLNGQEAYRWNMPAGTIAYSALSSTTIGNASSQGPFSFPATNLVQGDNVLAVEVHQASSTSSDIAFGMTLDSSGGNSAAYTPGASNSVRAVLPAFPLVWINEVLATNSTGITDNTGTREPWIELYNSGTNSINLNGYYLSDNFTNTTRWPFPSTASIGSKQFLVIFADGESNQTTLTELHTNFRVTNPSGSVALSRVNAGQTNIIDYLNYFGLTPNRSYGSYPDGQPQTRQIFVVTTPGATNNPTTSPLPVIVNEWMADNAGPDGFPDPADGLFQDWFELYNPNTNSVDLSGYTLTDTLSQPKKFTIPTGTSIAPLGFLLVWADNNTNQNGFNADLHANFQLSAGGEAIGLFAPDGTPQSTLTFGQQFQNVSEGRWPDGNTNGAFYFMTNSTPGTANILSAGTNTAPTLAFIGNKTINEGSLLRFTNSASDSDIPAQTLTFTLDPGAPAGASITPLTGIFTWTPGETDGPGTYSVTIRITDNGSSTLSAFETISITVNEVNSPPILPAIGNRTVNEGTLLTFAAAATDADVPANSLAYSLDAGAPSGAAINGTSGVFTWTPNEAQGPGVYSVTIRVVDNGTPPLSDAQTITITVNEVNSSPTLNLIGNKSVNEGALLSFTASASDPDQPAQTLTFTLDPSAPAGASIGASSGQFSWTPTEAQGPNTNSITIRVTDNGTPALSAFETISVIVSEVNTAPSLASISNRTVLEGALLTFTNSATDSDLPAQTLSYSLQTGAPPGAVVNSTNGVFTWTPSETQGGTTNLIGVIVADNGTPSLSATQTFTVTVLEVNSPPNLAAITNRTVAEGTLLTFTNSATDPDIPVQTLTYSLDPGSPAGASVDAATGVFTWTPSEIQGPGTNTITVRVTDNGSPVFSDAKSFTVIITEVNSPPSLNPIGNRSVNEGTLLSFTASASDPDLPAQTLTFSLDPGAPSGATINSASGLFTWAPSEAQGPATNNVTIRVTDSGSPALSAFETISIVVNEVNSPPALNPISNQSINEGSTLTFTATAIDGDLPAQTLTFTLDPGAPSGAAINSGTGIFTWTPTEAQGPATNSITVRVTDNGSPALSDVKTFSVTVNEVNSAPVLNAIGNRSVNEGALLSFTASASDPDLPAHTLTFSLDPGAPAGTAINSASGLFTWTPSEAQGPSTNNVTIRVTDNGTPALSDFETISIVVNEVNSAPVLAPIGSQSVRETTLLTFTASATDSDLPSQTLTYSIDAGAPSGTAINSSSGVFTWTPTEAQGPSTNSITIRVTDNGSPPLSDFLVVSIVVTESNAAPVLNPIGNKTIVEGSLLTFTATATDSDFPSQSLSFSLDPGAPLGAAINASSGVFTWTPTEAQGPSTNPVVVRVTDNGSPPASASETIQIIVTESNSPPSLVAITNRTIAEGTLLTFTNSATDPDLPAQALTFSLDPGAPTGASIDPASGVFAWTPSEAQGPATNSVTVRVTDNGSPPLSGTATFSVVVNEVNSAPQLAAIGDKTVNEGSLLSFSATATDSDLPAQTLSYSLDPGAPSGAAINAVSGLFTWTPNESQGGTTNSITVRVSDNGTPLLSDAKTFTVVVFEVNSAPALQLISNQTVAEGTLLSFTASATDPDLPAQSLTFSLDAGAPSGAGINPITGVFAWTPTESQGPATNNITVRVSDNGSPILSDARTFTVIVTEVNDSPVLNPISDRSVNEGTLLSFSVSASDSDLPIQTLTYSLDPGAPSGATINSTNGIFSWTPTEAQGPATNSITVRVTDNGSPPLSSTRTFSVTVNEVNSGPSLASIPAQVVVEGQLLSFTAVGSDGDLPQQHLTFSLDPSAPGNASIDPASGVFTWTPTEAQGPATNTIILRVTDDGTPALSTTQAVVITVLETNSPPAIAAIPLQQVDESTLFSLSVVAIDSDLPAQHLAFSLSSDAPLGLSVDPNSGLLQWIPSEIQGPSTNSFQVFVSDDGSPSMSATQNITIIVNEVNQPPNITPVPPQVVAEGTPLSLLVTATDPDLPAQALTFSLDPGAPSGAEIDPVSGLFSWTPDEQQGPATNRIAIRVTDNGTPAASAITYVDVVVLEVNSPPILDPIGNQTIPEVVSFTFTVHASDPDLPPQPLTFHLAAGAPSGCTINPTNGLLSWTPTEAQGPSTNTVTVIVSDNGSPAQTAAETFMIIVSEINVAPVLAPIADRSVHEGETVTFTASATDDDLPAQALAFSLDPGAPANASIDSISGLFTWVAGPNPGTNSLTIRVTDNGAPPLANSRTFSIIVVNQLRISSVNVSLDGSVVLSWSSISGKRYRVQYKDNLSDPLWQTLGTDIVASSTTTSATDETPPLARIYRVICVIP